MASLIKHKRVEFTELFYDLVFVYAISKTTGLIHHLDHGVLPIGNYITFLTCLFILVNTWMIQTMFTNRYGKNSFLNMCVLFVDMGFLMMVSNYFMVDWQSSFHIFTRLFGLLSATLFLQYAVQYGQSKDPNDRQLIQSFLIILGIRSAGVLIASFLPFDFGVPLYFTAVIISFILPVFYRRTMSLVPINFPHLVERVALLVIISFGEMIVGVANFFQADTFSWQSILYLFIVVHMFLLYFGEFDHALNDQIETLGLHLIYSHYLIFIGILMTTVSLTFLSEHESDHFFVVAFLFAGLISFWSGILINGRYNKPAYRWTHAFVVTSILILGVGFGASLIFAQSFEIVTILTTLTLLLLWVNFIRFYIKNHKASGDLHPLHLF